MSHVTTVDDRERLARVALSRLTEPGDPRLTRLVAAHGAEAVHAGLVAQRSGAGADAGARLRGLDPCGDLRRAARLSIRFVCPGDDEWPTRLADLDTAEDVNRRGGAPLGLWVRGGGRLEQLTDRSVAVVGSRSATTYGASVARSVAADVATAGVGVVSGAAFGIDQAAHRGALAVAGPTVAVLACGVDRAYPVAHRDLLAYVAEQGAVVSELPPGCAPTRLRFLARNRVIAALTHGTVVVEAAVRSGALNTANWAAALNRTLMGVPGPVTSASSEGVHELMRHRHAAVVTRGEDVLELVSRSGEHTATLRRGRVDPWDRLSDQDKQVLDAVPVSHPVAAGSLARTAGLSEATVVASLRRLVEGGFVSHSPDGWRLARLSGEGAAGA